MGKRKREKSEEYSKLRKKLKKIQNKINKMENVIEPESDNTESVSPVEIIEETLVEDPSPVEVIEETLVEVPPSLDDSIINLLGEEGEAETNTTMLHTELKKRWQRILKDGLSKEALETLNKKYQIPTNCTELTPPILNDIIQAALNEAGVNRDKRIKDKQVKMGVAISALGRVLTKLLEENSEENKENIEILSDSCRLLCDIFHSDSVTRRSLIVPGLNKDMKELINNTEISEFLFGNELHEKVKACKATKNSAKELKNTAVKPPAAKTKNQPALNSRGPLRAIQVQSATRQSGPHKQPYRRPPASSSSYRPQHRNNRRDQPRYQRRY